MEYSRKVIENGESVMLTFEDAVLEYKNGSIYITVDGLPELMYAFQGDTKRWIEGVIKVGQFGQKAESDSSPDNGENDNRNSGD